MLHCPFCQNTINETIDRVGKVCPFCQKNIFMEIEQNFHKIMEFSGEFIRLNHAHQAHPFLKTYRAGGEKDTEFFFEKGCGVSTGDTIELNSKTYQIVEVRPFFNPAFHIADKASTEIVGR